MISFRSDLKLHLSMIVLTALFFPGLVFILGLFFPSTAGGEPVYKDGKVVGFVSIGQEFRSPRYFHSRPSASGYNGAGSYGSNLSPLDTTFLRQVSERRYLLQGDNTGDVPEDLLTASGSGLDPDISVEAAVFQIKRVARERKLPESVVTGLVIENVEPVVPFFHARKKVNVLKLNLALDSIDGGK